MIQYILECVAFQLVFLIIYDFFLKGETFFQWNRVYLIGTYALSMILPWIKIEALKTEVSNEFYQYSEVLWNTNNLEGVVLEVPNEVAFNMPWGYVVLFAGMFLTGLFFSYKLLQLYRLKQKGEIRTFSYFTQIIIKDSSLAFSFLKSIFLGDKILATEHKAIIQHELIHIKQKHTYDLLFFEVMRIVAWFNPLVYVYQNRVSELHEFIADAAVAKTNKKEQYEFLLSQVFQTQNISFINQFAAKSLIKKRIVMLQKSKSKKIFQFKYLLVFPLVFGMLAFTAMEQESKTLSTTEINQIYDEDKETDNETNTINKKKAIVQDEESIPFAIVEEVPVFPGCSNAADKRKCFKDKMREHIRNNFMYPEEALKKGIQGRVSVLFTINKKGEITNIRHRGPDSILEDEAKRIIEKLPKMKAGKEQGKKVDVMFSIPITYKLSGSNEKQEEMKNASLKEVVIVGYGSPENKKQVSIEDIDVPFTVVEEVPVFPGCEAAENKRKCFQDKMNEHIRKNFNYPLEAQQKGIQGRVSVLFIIAENGKIEGMRFRGPDPLLEAEAKRILEKLPMMKPGKHKGENVRVPFAIPINFKLQVEEVALTEIKDVEDLDFPFTVVEEVPVFPGCEDAENKRKCFQDKMNEHIRKNFNYPLEAQEKGIQGRVSTMFIITENGKIEGMRLRGPDTLLEAEAKRILDKLPLMKPGKNKGKNVRVPFSVPINFSLK